MAIPPASCRPPATQPRSAPFWLDPVSEAANVANGSVQWHYALNNGAAQYLAAGQSVVEHYTVTVDDGHGSTATKVVTITITGTNDPASTPIDVDATVTQLRKMLRVAPLSGLPLTPRMPSPTRWSTTPAAPSRSTPAPASSASSTARRSTAKALPRSTSPCAPPPATAHMPTRPSPSPSTTSTS